MSKFFSFWRQTKFRRLGVAMTLGAGGMFVPTMTSGQDGLTATSSSTVSSTSPHLKPFTTLDNKPCIQETKLQNLPNVKIMRTIPNLFASNQDDDNLKLRLYQFQTCPFCCKVRAFLDYYGFGYEVVEVNSVTKKELKFSSYKKVPVLICQSWDNKQLNDSSFIISFLKTYFIQPDRQLDEIKRLYPIFAIEDEFDDKNTKKMYRNDNKYFVMFDDKVSSKEDIGNRREEREWRRWVDERLVHVISPNIYRSWRESLSAFRWFSENGNWSEVFSAPERIFIIYVGAAVMLLIGNKLKKKHNLKDDVRESLYDACREWIHAIGKHRQFMGGEKPNLADLAAYGVLTSFEGCQAFQDIKRNTEGFDDWFQATKNAVNLRLGAKEFGNI